MSKSTKKGTTKAPNPRPTLPGLARLALDEPLLDRLDAELSAACADWVDEHNLNHCFFAGCEFDHGEPVSLLAHVRSLVIGVVDDLRERIVYGDSCYVLGGAQ